MQTVARFKALGLVAMVMLVSACDQVNIKHSPVVARSNETVTFTATSTASGAQTIDIYVNGVIVHTCASSTCTYTGGPYTAYENGTVSFKARMKKTGCSGIGCSDTDGNYFFGITTPSYGYPTTYIPARYSGPSADKEDLVLHKATDYAENDQTFSDFLGHVHNKIYSVFGGQKIVKDNLSAFNIYVYTKDATSGGCGTVHADASTDMPWRDDDGVLHFENFQDCTNGGLTHFSAEGSNTKAFLHEAGHGVFGLGDEYCGTTSYFQPANEPNIWDLETTCQDEQTAKGRDPNACYQFCSNQGGWWGTHSGTTVMVNGMTGESWGVEGEERVKWFFDNL